jgi:hypothetical protein
MDTHKVFGDQEYNRCKSTSNEWRNNPLNIELGDITWSSLEVNIPKQRQRQLRRRSIPI